jgi:hypothetical protein
MENRINPKTQSSMAGFVCIKQVIKKLYESCDETSGSQIFINLVASPQFMNSGMTKSKEFIYG